MEQLEALRQTFPDHSKDLKLNLQSVLKQSKLSPERTWGCALASALASGNESLARACEADASAAGIADPTLDDARAAASLMAMNNVYYRFRHFMEGEYDTLPARLRMNRIARPASNKIDFELFCLVVSAINGCETRVRSHEKVVVEGGLSKDEVHDAVRIGAVMNGAASALFQRS